LLMRANTATVRPRASIQDTGEAGIEGCETGMPALISIQQGLSHCPKQKSMGCVWSWEAKMSGVQVRDYEMTGEG
jgi:electron transfer flavoprotein alpha/beta subunit